MKLSEAGQVVKMAKLRKEMLEVRQTCQDTAYVSVHVEFRTANGSADRHMLEELDTIAMLRAALDDAAHKKIESIDRKLEEMQVTIDIDDADDLPF